MTAQPGRWHTQAACRGMDPELFYRPPGPAADAALRVCADCPVHRQCAEDAKGEAFGIRGGRLPRRNR
ncbi:MAG: whiB2 [Frankiales bacterium]|nr:whiB2 [Frankiales bacterium]